MRKESPNIELKDAVSKMLAGAGTEIPKSLSFIEKELLSAYLEKIGVGSLHRLLDQVEVFLDDELNLASINRENVSDIDFNALAIKFGDHFSLTTIVKGIGSKNDRIIGVGWKIVRTILVKVLLPQLRLIPRTDSEYLISLLRDFIWSFSIIQGEEPDEILNQLKFDVTFKEFEFVLEPDMVESETALFESGTDEFICWGALSYSIEQMGEDLEHKYFLIASRKEWVTFFDDHKQTITVVPGKLNLLIAVLHQLEAKEILYKNKKKGCWKIWQTILVGGDGVPFSKGLRQISSRVNNPKSKKDQKAYDFGKKVIKDILEEEEKSASKNKNYEL